MSKQSEPSKLKEAVVVVGPVVSAVRAVRGLRGIRQEKDKVVLVNALASAVVAITGMLIAVRVLRKGEQ
jgi:hypothetical protein